MAIIIESQTGHWLGKEIYPGQQYSCGQDKFNHPTEKLLKVGFNDLAADISKHLFVNVLSNTPDSIVKMLALELCSKKYGMLYLQDDRAPFRVRKILEPPM